MASRRKYVGLDLETASLDGPPIEIGLAVVRDGTIVTMSRHVPWSSAVIDKYWDEESAAIHGLSPFVAYDWKARQDAVVSDMKDWLRTWTNGQDREFWPVGKNVGAFDLRLLKQWMPDVAALFSHRHVELNSAMLVYAGMQGVPFEDVKAQMANNHRAASDAAEALQMWVTIQGTFR